MHLSAQVHLLLVNEQCAVITYLKKWLIKALVLIKTGNHQICALRTEYVEGEENYFFFSLVLFFHLFNDDLYIPLTFLSFIWISTHSATVTFGLACLYARPSQKSALFQPAVRCDCLSYIDLAFFKTWFGHDQQKQTMCCGITIHEYHIAVN